MYKTFSQSGYVAIRLRLASRTWKRADSPPASEQRFTNHNDSFRRGYYLHATLGGSLLAPLESECKGTAFRLNTRTLRAHGAWIYVYLTYFVKVLRRCGSQRLVASAGMAEGGGCLRGHRMQKNGARRFEMKVLKRLPAESRFFFAGMPFRGKWGAFSAVLQGADCQTVAEKTEKEGDEKCHFRRKFSRDFSSIVAVFVGKSGAVRGLFCRRKRVKVADCQAGVGKKGVDICHSSTTVYPLAAWIARKHGRGF